MDASDDPADQDKAREIRVMHDYASLKKQIGSKKNPQKAAVDESRLDKDPPPQFEKGDADRGNPDYMKSVSYDDEKKWERLQRMRKASKKKEVRAKANEEVVHESGWHRRNPEKVGTPEDPDYDVLRGQGKPVKDSKPATTGKASKKPPGIYKPDKDGKMVRQPD